MKKLLKWLGFALAGVLGLMLIGAVAVYATSNAKLHKTFTVAVQSIAIPTGAAAVERGRHLALSRGCVDCHGADFAGNKVIDDAPMGRVYGANLTSGAGGLSGYRDEDWVRAIRHGVARDGHGIFIMPSDEYSQLSDADVGALVAFMKTLPPVNRERAPLALGPVSRALLATGKMKLAAEVIDHAKLKPPAITPGVTVEYGRYLAVACITCHGTNYSGGKIAVGPPDWPPARNLTPHPSGNLAAWQEADFVRAIREGKRPDGSAINPVMPRSFAAMNDEELGALWVFLRSLPPAPTGVR
jgi:cytochrome c553